MRASRAAVPYPEIIDTTAIRAARVEAMLRTLRPNEQENEPVMLTYYIELHLSPTELTVHLPLERNRGRTLDFLTVYSVT